MKRAGKFELYEHSVQDPEEQVELFNKIYHELNKGMEAHSFREDFCGTLTLSIGWIKTDKTNSAISIDLDKETLAYAKKHHIPKLSVSEKRRLTVKRQNVLVPTSPKVDLIGAGNFSFYIFKERPVLVEYFRTCYKSLKKNGLLVLEMAGGPGMIEQRKEQKTIKVSRGRKFRYIWHQKSFNPVSRNGKYAIHFRFNDGTMVKNAFTYDWRVWTIPEVRDALNEAGFKNTVVYWDNARSNEHYNYVRTEKMTNDPAWIVQVVGVKR